MKEDGTMASSEWITYDKNRYYFRSWGGMYTGIHTIGGTKYAFQSWGGLYHDQTFTIGGKTYYANSDGTFATGWVQNGGKTYYFDEDGTSHTGWLLLDGTYYWINANGTRRDDELFQYDGNYYYVDKNGVMATSGWVYWIITIIIREAGAACTRMRLLPMIITSITLDLTRKWQSAGSRLAEIHTISETGAA